MPVTTLVTLVLSVLCAAALTIMAMVHWGVLNTIGVLVVMAVAARWALAHVHLDDGHT